MDYDVAVVGLGGMGSAIAAQCAARGASVIGLEQFARGNELGSSIGRSRLIRKAYFEDSRYVPLLLRAYDLWRELERESGADILRVTGLLLVGREDGDVVRGCLGSAREHELPVERWSRDEIKQRYPTLQVEDGEVGVFESDGGVLCPERAIEAQLAVAEKRGAELRFETPVKDWRASNGGCEVICVDETHIAARTLILALGPWFQQVMNSLGVELRIQRNVQAWFAPRTLDYDAAKFPPFLLERAGLPAPLYGFPDFGDGVKAAFHGGGTLTDPTNVERTTEHGRDIAPLAQELESWMPGAAGSFLNAKVCMYSLTPDEHFVIDRHPAHPHLILCGGFSGHGFKFAPVTGEIAAALALNGKSRHDIGFLSLRRFAR
jgi:sarcosine oxidase